MLGINPDTILLGESTNDATSDLQGDGWHGAMTYPSFTRPVWGWLSEATGTPYLDANGDELTEAWFFGQPIGGIPRYTAREFAEAVRPVHRRHPVARAARQHAAARHPRHRAIRDERRARSRCRSRSACR